MGHTPKNMGNYDQAAEVYQQALDIEPNFLDCLYNLGNVRVMQNDIEAAVALWTRLLEIEPRRFPMFMHLTSEGSAC